MTDFGRRAGDMKKSVYDTDDDGVVDEVEEAPAHKTSHQSAGDDELNASGLTGRINYVDRGDPDSYDYDQATLTSDGQWHDLVLSSVVPEGAKAVHIRAAIKDDVLGSSFMFKKPGNTYNFNSALLRNQTANITFGENFFVSCDADRVVEYKLTNTGFLSINLTVCGWLI